MKNGGSSGTILKTVSKITENNRVARNHSRTKEVVKPADWKMLTFSQKVAWRCGCPDPLVDYRTLVDKFLVKEFVRPYFKVAESYLVVEKPFDINTSLLPETYVMKSTHGWNQSLLIVDGSIRGGNRSLTGAGYIADSELLQKIAKYWIHSEQELQRRSRERHYQFVKPRIIFEQFLKPVDYELQLFLFNGHCRFAMVFYRQFFHEGVTHRLYDEHWQLLNPGSAEAESYYEWIAEATPQPPYAMMQNLEQLCHSIDHVRVDFYVSDEQYYFSEFSFSHSGGGAGFIGKYDAVLGGFWST